MNTPVMHRFVAMALSVVVTLALFEIIGQSASPEHRHQVLVRMQADTAAPT